jgi:recombinational DNA repair protein (RecF pathway)
MEKLTVAERESHKCAKCREPLYHFIAYIPTDGEVCLKCFAEYAQAEDNL